MSACPTTHTDINYIRVEEQRGHATTMPHAGHHADAGFAASQPACVCSS